MTTVSTDQSDSLTTMTSLVSDILQKRSVSTANHSQMKFNDIPSPLVGEIASYLHQKTYAGFSRTSRKVFVSCNSPNTLRNMDLTKVTDYTAIRLEQFPHLNHLVFNLKRISQFNDKNGQRFHGNKQLRSLLIYGDGSTSSDMNVLASDSSPCFASVRCLAFREFIGGAAMNFDIFVKMLAKFRYLTHLLALQIAIVPIATLSADKLRTVCPDIVDLNSFSTASRLTEIMVAAWGSRLHTLSVDSALPDISNNDMSGLKRLFVASLHIRDIEAILDSTDNLREIAFIPNMNTPPYPNLNDQDVMDIIKRCIVEYRSLEFFYISTRCHFEAICSGIHRGLFVTKKRKRQKIMIKLNVDVREISNADDFVCSVSKIIQVLEISEVKEWMLTIVPNHSFTGLQQFDEMRMTAPLSDLEDTISKNVAVVMLKQGIIICKMIDLIHYREWWRSAALIMYY